MSNKDWAWTVGGYFASAMLAGGMMGIAQAVPFLWTIVSLLFAFALASG